MKQAAVDQNFGTREYQKWPQYILISLLLNSFMASSKIRNEFKAFNNGAWYFINYLTVIWTHTGIKNNLTIHERLLKLKNLKQYLQH